MPLRFWAIMILGICSVCIYLSWGTATPAFITVPVICLPFMALAIYVLLPSRYSGF